MKRNLKLTERELQSMTETTETHKLLLALETAYVEAFEEGDWERVDYVGLCLDEIRTQLKEEAA
jgi:hypothetical protein